MQKWEYLDVIKLNSRQVDVNGIRQEVDETLAALFNRLGEEGWELVAVTDSSRFFFKRPKK